MPADPNQYWMDTIADDVLAEMQEEEDWVVDAVLGGGRAPGTVQATEKEKLAFFKRYLMNPDGTWNVQHQQNLMNSMDEKSYISIIQALNSNDEKGLIGVDQHGRALNRAKHSLARPEPSEELEGY